MSNFKLSFISVPLNLKKKKKGGSKDSLISFFKKETVPFNFTPTPCPNSKHIL